MTVHERLSVSRYLSGWIVLALILWGSPARGQEQPESNASESSPPEWIDVLLEFQGEDGFPLEAKLSLPANRQQPAATVFYLHGAGLRTFDNPFGYRDEQGQVRVGKYLDYHAQELAKRGLAFFRMSKRGCKAAPAPKWMQVDREVFSKLTLSQLLADYASALKALRKREEIDADRIVLLASSEGTWLAPRLASRAPEGIVGVVMNGFAADNLKDTITWQNTLGPWRNVQHLLPAARDGELTHAEFDAAIAEKPELGQVLAFEPMDADGDERLTREDMQRINQPRLEAILKAYEERDDDFLWQHLVNLNSAYLQEEWEGEPNLHYLRQLDLPLAIFHGELDGSCRVEGVREVADAFEAAGKQNLKVRIYPVTDHSLNWTWQAARDDQLEAYRDMFDHARELGSAKAASGADAND